MERSHLSHRALATARSRKGLLSTVEILSNMIKGSIKQGAYHPLQMGYMRPNEFCSKHCSPVKNLFMGGACTYPGGTVIFGPGYLAANAVAEDLEIKKWWKEPEGVTKAKKKGML